MHEVGEHSAEQQSEKEPQAKRKRIALILLLLLTIGFSLWDTAPSLTHLLHSLRGS